jgi:hypothetical protein
VTVQSRFDFRFSLFHLSNEAAASGFDKDEIDALCINQNLGCSVAHLLTRLLALAALQDGSAGGALTGLVTGGEDASVKCGRRNNDLDTSLIYTESQA